MLASVLSIKIKLKVASSPFKSILEEIDVLEVEHDDGFLITYKLELGRLERDMEVGVSGLIEPLAPMLGETEPIAMIPQLAVILVIPMIDNATVLLPHTTEIPVDGLHTNALDHTRCVDESELSIDAKVDNIILLSVHVEIREAEEDMVTGAFEEVEIAGKINLEGFGVVNGLRKGGKSGKVFRLCDVKNVEMNIVLLQADRLMLNIVDHATLNGHLERCSDILEVMMLITVKIRVSLSEHSRITN